MKVVDAATSFSLVEVFHAGYLSFEVLSQKHFIALKTIVQFLFKSKQKERTRGLYTVHSKNEQTSRNCILKRQY